MNERFQSRPIIHGDVFVLPEQVNFREQVDGAIDYILLYLDPQWIAAIAHEAVDPDRVEILPHFPKPDQLIYQIGLSLKALLETNGNFSQLYAESLATTLAVHLLQHYSGQKPTLQACNAQFKLDAVIDYMHTHYDRNISLSELATQAQMSLHYFARSFKQAVGASPHQYLIQYRIERAKQLLRQNELTIVDIAQRVGFIDQSHFSRHFKNVTGITPRQWLQQ